ncbi:MAG TPA: indole-3-glycerol-phosphate synthase [Methanospirillum sp.]|nr:indole-3-glycerol-phosphate synthase [Methanospirillum sp.]
MILDQIVAGSVVRAAALPADMTLLCSTTNSFKTVSKHQPISLSRAVKERNGKNAIIAEIKPASPSRGKIRDIGDPAIVAQDLIAGGCCALSVITEPSYFQGSSATIQKIRQMVQVPILRKDFIVDKRQLIETRMLGADAVLLIAAVLGEELGEFVDYAMKEGLEPLVEVHNRQEVIMALDTRAELIGVNNRNLKTFRTDLSTTIHLAPLVRQAGRTVISESGVTWPCDVRTLKSYADGYLIGSSIMASNNPQRRLEGFVYA